jgi:hypothetical protein
MDCESAAEELRLVLETCSYVKFKTTKGKFFFRVVVENEVNEKRYSTELMVQGIVEITIWWKSGDIRLFE